MRNHRPHHRHRERSRCRREQERERAQRDEPAKLAATVTNPPQVDARAALAYRERLEETLRRSAPATKRALLRECVQEMKLLPEDLEVVIDYALPAPIMKIGSGSLDAGAYRDRPGSGGPLRIEKEDQAPPLEPRNRLQAAF